MPSLFAARSIANHTDGQYANGTEPGERLGEQNTTAATLAFTAKPIDGLTIRGFYSYDRDDDGPPVTATLKTGGASPTLSCNLGGTGGAYFCGALPNVSDLPKSFISLHTVIDPLLSSELLHNARGRPDILFNPDYLDHFGFKQDVHNANLRADYNFAQGYTLSGIASYSYTKQERLNTFFGRDFSAIANPYYLTSASAIAAACAAGTSACYREPYYAFNSLQESLYREMFFEGRLSTPQNKWIHATAGASYYEVKRPGEFGYSLTQLGRSDNADAKIATYTPAVFGGIYIEPFHALTVSLEARYQWDKITQTQIFPTLAPELKHTYGSFSPRISVDYKFRRDLMAYATFSRGYRPGGFNSTLAALAPSDLALITAQVPNAHVAYDQEQLDNYEIGVKGSWFDNRLRATLDVYYMKWQKGQVTNTAFAIRPDGTSTGAVVTFNQGTVDLKGIEFEGAFAVTRKLTLETTLQYADNTIKKYVYTDGIKIDGSSNVDGNELDQTPKWAWTVSPSYQDHLAGDWGWFGRIDYIHRGRVYTDPTNVAWLQPRDLVNLRIGLTDERQGLRIEGYVTNLFQNDSISQAYRGNDSVYTTSNGAVVPGFSLTLNDLRLGLPAKREFGIRVGKTF